MRRAPARALLLAVLSVLACAPSPASRIQRAEAAADVGNLAAARHMLEEERRRSPDSAEVRVALGTVYYRLARDILDRGGDETRYLNYFERSLDEFVAAVELEPRHPDPHFYMAVIDMYRGDLRGAERGLQNTFRLRGSPLDYTNLGELYVYKGDLRSARDWSLKGLRQGAGAGPTTFNQMLIHWREGDLRGANRDFELLWRDHPYMLSTINAAPVPREPDSFEEYAGYCCGSPGCGPYLQEACADLGLAVKERSLSEEGALKELRIEMETQRRLRQIYESRKELEIEVESESEAGSDGEPAP